MLSPSQVSCVLVTYGRTDLSPVLDSLLFSDIVIYDNSVETDEKTYGRALAVERAKNDVIYSQDDDIIHSHVNQFKLLAEYQPGLLTGCMWDEWNQGAHKQGIPNGYDDLVFAGSGSIYDRDLPGIACDAYFEHFPLDDFFRLWADTIIGILTPNRQINMRFEELPEADDPYRMSKQPGFTAQKAEAIRRARFVRDWLHSTPFTAPLESAIVEIGSEFA